MSKRTLGFTLLEVMIAVVILAVGLSSLFTSEAGAIRIAQRARTTTIATMLARCKMGEIEERIGKEGWPGALIEGRDDCCTDAEHEGFTCEWMVDRITLPEAAETGESALDRLKDNMEGGGDKEGAEATPDPNSQTPNLATPAPGQPPTDPTQNFGIPLTGIGGMLGGGGTGTGGGGDPLASLAMEFAFPIMKPIIEEQVRRAQVTVRWNEGSAEQSFDVVQYLVNELPFINPETDEEEGTNTGGTGGTGGAGTGSTGTGTGTGTGGNR